MFGGAPPPPSPEEVRQQETLAKATVIGALVTCGLLYLSPFAVEYAGKLF